MSIDAELLKQLIVTFKTELQEQTQLIIDNLLLIEKGDKNNLTQSIEVIFRAAHNIKGTSRSLGINNISDIAHRLESIFNAIKHNEIELSPKLIDLCLEAVDKIRINITAYINHIPIDYDLDHLLDKLEKSLKNKFEDKISEKKIADEIAPVLTQDQYETIHVSVDKIDKISSLMENIQANKITIEDVYLELGDLVSSTKEFFNIWTKLKPYINETRIFNAGNDHFLNISSKVNKIHKSVRLQLNELSLLSNTMQEEVRMLRLVPIENLLCTLPRYVRDLSNQLNKKIEINIKDNGVKIDKFILERLKDPIIHILRNAIDHGIEIESEREKKGKSKIGNINIDIKEEGDQIFIYIKDDGAGIDKNKIAQSAIDKNIVTQDELKIFNDTEIMDLIFKPGFSTKDEISTISGRGVGLNVVKENISDLKGQITIETGIDQFTLFILRVPITLSSEIGLLVKSNSQLFIIPTSSVESVHSIEPNEVLNVSGGQAVILDKKTIPLYSLSAVLGFDQVHEMGMDKVSLVVVNKEASAIAFLVEDVLSEREIVIKRLTEPLQNTYCISGGALLDRNQVVLVLNPSDLVDAALHTNKINRVTFQQGSKAKKIRPSILVVDDSITTRTLEKNILENKNYDVTVAVNGKEAWDILQKQTFSLLITDVAMPIMDGFTLTDHVKKSERLRELPVIIVTSMDSPAEKARGMEVGADAYIVKNEFESGALLEIVEQLV